jgi:hypothetical protein
MRGCIEVTSDTARMLFPDADFSEFNILYRVQDHEGKYCIIGFNTAGNSHKSVAQPGFNEWDVDITVGVLIERHLHFEGVEETEEMRKIRLDTVFGSTMNTKGIAVTGVALNVVITLLLVVFAVVFFFVFLFLRKSGVLL